MFFGKLKPRHGRVHINNAWCKGCGFCIKFCPQKVLEMSPSFNAKGYHPPEVRVTAACRDCHYCEIVCPEFAIYVTRDDDEPKDPNQKETPRA